MTKEKETKDLAVRPGGLLAKDSTLNEMFDNDGTFQLPVGAPLPVYSIIRETAQFEVSPGKYVELFEGHILHWHNANAYYDEGYTDGKTPPVCISTDGVRPTEMRDLEPQHDFCELHGKKCPLNEYGTAINDDGTKGDGKACQNTIRLYILVDGEIIPIMIKAPPTSLGDKAPLKRFLVGMTNATVKAGVGTMYQLIKVRFSLYKEKFKKGEASILKLEEVKILTDRNDEKEGPEIERIAALYKQFKPLIAGSRIAEDMQVERSEDAPVETAGNEVGHAPQADAGPQTDDDELL